MLNRVGRYLFPLVLVALPASAVAKNDPLVLEEAAVIDYAIPTADPCVIGGLFVDVEDFVNPNDTAFNDTLFYLAFTQNVCTGEYLHFVMAEPVYQNIGESDFEYSNGHDVGDLNVTLPGFDWITMTQTSIALDLHWQSTHGVSDSSFTVMGTATAADFGIVLDDSISWNRWGSDVGASWAGMWPCRFASAGTPGCLGQQWPPPRIDPR
jgi:hypothetical protein